MKTKISIFLIMMGVLITSPSMSQNVPSYVPTNGLVGWWPFNGNANDESGNGNNGTVNGATLTTDRFGNINKSYVLNKSNYEYIQVPQSNLINSVTDISISLWTNINSSAPYNHYVNKTDPNGGPSGIQFVFASNSQGLYFYYGSNPQFFQTNTVVSLGVWHHLSLTYKYDGTPSNSICRFYVDGVCTDSFPTTTNLLTSTYDLKFGSYANSNTNTVDGNIDDIGIWNRTLSQQEITNLYNAPNPNTSIPIFNCPGAFMSPSLSNGLVGWWPFCGDAEDESGNGNDGTVNGATLTSDRFGNTNSAYGFDGIDDYIEVIHSNMLNAFPLTISTWFKTSSNQQNAMLVNKYGCQTYNGYSLNLNYGSPSAYYYGSNGSKVNFDSIGTPPSNANDGIWHNALMSVTPSGVSYYLDGIKILDRSFVGTGTGVGTSSTTIENLLFGRYAQGICGAIGQNYFYNGIIDDIGIWNRALDSSEVVQLYQSGITNQTIAGSCDTLIFNANITGFNPVTYANQIKVYPNPASDNLVIDCGSNYTGVNGHFIKITNTLGQVLYNSPINSQITNIQLVPPQWVNGTYVVQFLNPQGVVLDTKTIIIQ